MHNYVYVVALNQADSTVLSFKHAFVTAETDEDAYCDGWKLVYRTSTDKPVNDYVVRLGRVF